MPSAATWVWRLVARATPVFVLVMVIGAVVGFVGEPPYEYADLRPSATGESSVDLLTNNLGVAATLAGLGALTSGAACLPILAINGYIVGQLVRVVLDAGMSQVLVSGLLPHVVPEVLGLSLASAVSVVPAALLVRRLRDQPTPAFSDVGRTVLIAVAAVALLIAIGAVLEATASAPVPRAS